MFRIQEKVVFLCHCYCIVQKPVVAAAGIIGPTTVSPPQSKEDHKKILQNHEKIHYKIVHVPDHLISGKITHSCGKVHKVILKSIKSWEITRDHVKITQKLPKHWESHVKSRLGR